MNTFTNRLKAVVGFTVFGAAAVAITAFAASVALDSAELARRGSPAEGTVIGLSESRDNDGALTYAPVIEYSGPEGERRTFVPALSSSRPSYAEGDKVSILLPSDGGQPAVNSFGGLWLGPIMASGFALLFMTAFIFLLTAEIRRLHGRRLLAERGVRIEAKVLSVTEHEADKTGPIGFVVKAQWLNPRDGKVYVFDSESLPYNPEEYLGETVEVVVLSENPATYRMALDSLPQAGN